MAGPTPEALDRLFQEAKDVLERQLTDAAVVEEKAAQVFRFGALVLGLVLAGTSVLYGSAADPAPPPVPVVVLLVAGLATTTGAIVLAFMVFRAARWRVGLSPERLRASLAFDLDERTFLVEAVKTYEDSIIENAAVAVGRTRLLDAATWMLVSGIGTMASGTTILFVLGVHL